MNLDTFTPNAGPNVVSYTPPPFDIIEFFHPGTPLDHVIDFPLTAA